MSKEKTKTATALQAYLRSATKLVTSLRAPPLAPWNCKNLRLRQVDNHNPALNLVVARDVEGTLATARWADDAVAGRSCAACIGRRRDD